MAVGRWVPETERIGCEIERICRGVRVIFRTTEVLHPNYARLAVGTVFIIPVWATGPARDALVAKLWFQLAIDIYGVDWVMAIMAQMLADAPPLADEAMAAD